ncbi:MAG: hypothetical protein QM586_05515 [Xenophilus sp.]
MQIMIPGGGMEGIGLDMVERHLPYDSRPLSPHEREYVDMIIGRQIRAVRWVLGGIGILLLMFAVTFPVVMVFDSTFHNPEKIMGVLFALGLCAATFLIGLFFCRTGFRRRLVFDGQACKIFGVLKRQSARVVNPKTGGSNTITRFMVDGFFVVFPTGSEELLIPLEGKPVEVTVAVVSVSNPVAIFGRESVFSEPPEMALALRFCEVIDIQKAIESHGIGFLRNRVYLEVVEMLLYGVVMLLAIWFLDENYPDLDFFWIIPLAMGVCVLIFAFFLILKEALMSFGLIKKRVSYIEKLKG